MHSPISAKCIVYINMVHSGSIYKLLKQWNSLPDLLLLLFW